MINCDFYAASTIFDYLPFYRTVLSYRIQFNIQKITLTIKKEEERKMPWKIQRVCVCVCRIENSPKRNKTNECKAKESEIISYSISRNITLKGKKEKKISTLFFLKEKMEKRWKKKKK